MYLPRREEKPLVRRLRDSQASSYASRYGLANTEFSGEAPCEVRPRPLQPIVRQRPRPLGAVSEGVVQVRRA